MGEGVRGRGPAPRARRRHSRCSAPELAESLARERFLREIQLAARLAHPHILPLYDSGETDGTLWFSMPVMEGLTLRDRLQREPRLPVDEALRIAERGGRRPRLRAPARRGPPRHQAREHPAARRARRRRRLRDRQAVLAASSEARLTQIGVTIGTPAYMSPEQAAGEGRGRPQRPLRLGCVLYEMLTGTPPFSASTPQAMVARHLTDPVPSLWTVRPSVPAHVEAVVSRVLAKVPADRFLTAAAFRAALARPEEAEARATGSPRGRRRWMLAVVAAGLALPTMLAVGRLFRHRVSSLHADRVVVFPLTVSGETARRVPSGEDVTAAMVAALNSTQVLKGINGWRLSREGRKGCRRRQRWRVGSPWARTPASTSRAASSPATRPGRWSSSTTCAATPPSSAP